MCSNNINSICIEKTDRRYFVPDLSKKYMNNKEYFSNLFKNLHNQYAGNVVYTYFMDFNLSINEFYLLHLPQTKRLDEIKDISKNSALVFIDETRKTMESNEFTTSTLYTLYLNWCSTNHEKDVKKKLFKSLIVQYGVQFKHTRNGDIFIL